MLYRGFLLLGGKYIDAEHIKNGHLFPMQLEISREQSSVQTTSLSCCGRFNLKPGFNLEQSDVFIYILQDGETRPKIKKWGKASFRFFDNEADFRMSLARFHEKDTPGSQICAGCAGVFYARDDIHELIVD